MIHALVVLEKSGRNVIILRYLLNFMPLATNDCVQCGTGSNNAEGILFTKKKTYIDIVTRTSVESQWESRRKRCSTHLAYYSKRYESEGYDTKIEGITSGIERR